MALILELQTALHEGQTPVTRAWCRVSIFNEAGWIMAGCWRLPLRFPPVDLLPPAPSAFVKKVNMNFCNSKLAVLLQIFVRLLPPFSVLMLSVCFLEVCKKCCFNNLKKFTFLKGRLFCKLWKKWQVKPN